MCMLMLVVMKTNFGDQLQAKLINKHLKRQASSFSPIFQKKGFIKFNNSLNYLIIKKQNFYIYVVPIKLFEHQVSLISFNDKL